MSAPPSNPPPIPARPAQSMMPSTAFGSPYNMGMDYGYNNSYMGNSFGSPYGMGYGGGYNNMYGNSVYPSYNNGMYGPSPESNFIRVAEESSRNAFQSIESVVGAVTSVANMLNSTHNAVFSSFRAVIGVVEQFGGMKRQLAAVVSVTLFRWIRIIWRKLLVFLKLKPANYASVDSIWTDIQSEPSQSIGISWPAILFWLVALGGPYLIYRCVSQMVKTLEEKQKWATGTAEHYTAEALYDFAPQSQQELGFQKGDHLRIAPKSEQPRISQWILAASEDGQRIGLVPINYVKVTQKPTNTPPRSISPQLPNNSGVPSMSSTQPPEYTLKQAYEGVFNDQRNF
ncbi:unnamed protein product [Bursaphelenchus okinawaensis]|uniref:Peroxisomal membrane protein PEX13 n=1 Tax=Bursaphelenchus okinawaensis TaxID=465554 RepID=A0A811K8F4_9BILA|nr:unnamed protein product [Bursaphelenchus okinawaensis]CAG9094313.1 unnamed protein product [Bursaphelenchus okinawaensis]